jgi:hypothetical protein
VGGGRRRRWQRASEDGVVFGNVGNGHSGSLAIWAFRGLFVLFRSQRALARSPYTLGESRVEAVA